MVSPRIDRSTIQRFLAAAAENLRGEWLLLGGSAAAAWYLPSRVTEDIDIISLDGDRESRLDLMDLALDQELPVEAVNSAADYFLRRIDGWRDEMEVLMQGQATIYRPTPTLFVLTKIGRLSQSDLDDCLALLAVVREQDWRLDRERLVREVQILEPSADADLEHRRRQLLAELRLVSGAGGT